MAKPQIPARLRALCEQQNHRCCYCGVRFRDKALRSHPNAPTIEHVKRRADGGVDAWENLAAACALCNSARGDRDAESFYNFVRIGGLAGLRIEAVRDFERRKGYGPWGRAVRVREHEIVPTPPSRQAYFDLLYGPWMRSVRA